ncbi:MAG: DUF1295 domain-containing protein, partial [Actinobacteria bacterium]|nr:DUF1295 domain-containing protein [Actinomycetota bacterium]
MHAAAGFPVAAWSIGLAWSVLGVLAVLIATFIASRIAGKHSVIDTAWGLLFVAVAVACFLTSNGHGNSTRRVLLLVLPVLWGLRLGF